MRPAKNASTHCWRRVYRWQLSFPFDRRNRATLCAGVASLCDTCHAGCCRAYNLLITVYDALVISRDLSLPIAEFASVLPMDADKSKRMGDLHVPLRFSDPGFEDSFFYIILKRVPSALFPGSVKCYFLQEWTRSEPVAERRSHPGAKVAGRCGIYGSRPIMCRAYPAFLHANGALGFVTNPQPLESSKTIPAFELCPEPWTVEAFTKDPSQTVHTLITNKYEIGFQNELIKEWNAAPRSLREFFPHAAACYANRFRLAPALVATPPPIAAAAEQAAVGGEK
jgi:Fe-S-cluster containining protein